MSLQAVQMRWVVFGPNKQLEYRYAVPKLDGNGNEWTLWIVVPNVNGHDAAMEDLAESGGIAGAP